MKILYFQQKRFIAISNLLISVLAICAFHYWMDKTYCFNSHISYSIISFCRREITRTTAKTVNRVRNNQPIPLELKSPWEKSVHCDIIEGSVFFDYFIKNPQKIKLWRDAQYE